MLSGTLSDRLLLFFCFASLMLLSWQLIIVLVFLVTSLGAAALFFVFLVVLCNCFFCFVGCALSLSRSLSPSRWLTYACKHTHTRTHVVITSQSHSALSLSLSLSRRRSHCFPAPGQSVTPLIQFFFVSSFEECRSICRLSFFTNHLTLKGREREREVPNNTGLKKPAKEKETTAR